MNEKDILKRRWEEIDNVFAKYQKQYKYNVKERVQAIINKYKITDKNLYLYLNNKDLSMFRIELQDALDENLDEYTQFKIQRLIKRTKIKYIEILEILIELAYIKIDNNNKKFEDELFYNVADITSKQFQEDSYDIKTRIKKFRLFPIPEYLIPNILATPLYLGYAWLEYKERNRQYVSNKMYRKVVVDLMGDRLDLDTYDNAINRDRKSYITALDNEIASLSSQVALWGMEKQGIKKVKFVAVIDERTTKVCKSMNGQIFDIKGRNTYMRYESESDTSPRRYVTDGLMIGQNQPALHYNCRSTLVPYK